MDEIAGRKRVSDESTRGTRLKAGRRRERWNRVRAPAIFLRPPFPPHFPLVNCALLRHNETRDSQVQAQQGTGTP
jgi:hypothetical protein